MPLAVLIYKKQLVHRYDDDGYIKYFTAADYPGLHAEPFSFVSGRNRLHGFFYSRGNEKNELIVFCHGIGGGHRSYMAEIAALAQRGYTVFAYDNTGCFASEGKDIGGFTQSLADAAAAADALQREDRLRGFSHVFVLGHSWGGYAAANIPAFTDVFEKAVVISGFTSVPRMLEGQLAGVKGPLKGILMKRLRAIEKKNAPRFFGADALDTVGACETRFLFAHSVDDAVVPYAKHAALLREKYADRARFLICEGKKHNPNYAQDAVEYMNEVFGRFNAEQKAGRLKTLREKQAFFADTDWRRMTAQDESFWNAVEAFLEEA